MEPAYIQHLTVKKNLLALDPIQFVNRSKKGSCRLIERNARKIRSRCIEIRLCFDVYVILIGDESCIYAYAPESKQQSKQMIACFFGKTGHVAFVRLERRRTINYERYTTICLPVVFQEIRKTNRLRRIILHHDNVSSHTSAQTTAFLSTQNIDLMSHLPYSPDLAPNDFFLFPYKKKKKIK